MARPYIMPLGFIDRSTEEGTVIFLTNPKDSRNLNAGAPVTVWRYLPEHLALARLRGSISAVGYTTATFTTVATHTDPRWPLDENILRPRTPVFLALEESYEPDPGRMLTQELAERMETYAKLYSDLINGRGQARSAAKGGV